MTRQERFKELECLIQFQFSNNIRANTVDTLGDIIDELLEELYPINLGKESECTNDSVTCEREDCCKGFGPLYGAEPICDSENTMTYEEFIAALNEAAEIEVDYMGFHEGVNKLSEFKGGRLARKSWDNGLNYEYIKYVPMVGLVKVYQTSSIKIDSPEIVVHSYEPSQDDEKSNDWYFL